MEEAQPTRSLFQVFPEPVQRGQGVHAVDCAPCGSGCERAVCSPSARRPRDRSLACHFRVAMGDSARSLLSLSADGLLSRRAAADLLGPEGGTRDAKESIAGPRRGTWHRPTRIPTSCTTCREHVGRGGGSPHTHIQ
jgi:hypothetical protein